MPAALAQSSKPIRLVVPFPAGGATDLFARTLSQKMGERLGTSIVIDNKPGAGGSLGSDMAAKATAGRPDLAVHHHQHPFHRPRHWRQAAV